MSSNLDLHKTHELGGDLWKILMSSCLKNIDPNAKGNSKLYDYIKNATEISPHVGNINKSFNEVTPTHVETVTVLYRK